MSNIPTNFNNIPGYIGYQQAVPNTGVINSAGGQGAVQQNPVDFFAPYVDLSAGVQVNGGQPNWTFGINDVIAAGPNVKLEIQLEENYLNGAAVQAPLTDPTWGTPSRTIISYIQSTYGAGSSYGFNFSSVHDTIGFIPISYINFGDTAMSLEELNDWYSNHPFNASLWSDASFWAQAENQKIYVFNTLVQLAQGKNNVLVSPSRTQSQVASDGFAFGTFGVSTPFGGQPPPSDITVFVNNLLGLKVYNNPNSSHLVSAAITQTPLTPSFSSGTVTAENALQVAFGAFIREYQKSAEGLGYTPSDLSTPEGFAGAWFDYLKQGAPLPSTVPAEIPIVYVDASASPGTVFEIDAGKSVATPGYGSSSTITPLLAVQPNVSQLKQDFIDSFLSQMQTDFNVSMGIDVSSPNYFNFAGINLPSGATPEQMFNSNFKLFMNYLMGQGGSTTMANYDSFITQWQNFVGPTAILNATETQTNSQSLLTYSAIYNVFYPSGTPEHDHFVSNLNSFVNGFLGQNGTGTFNPSMMIDQWFKNLVKGMYGPQFVSVDISLDDANFESVRILNLLYRHLASMVQNIQQLAVAQASRLDFYTRYQSVYTTTMLTVPVVIQNPAFASPDSPSTNNSNNPSNVITKSPIDSNNSGDIKRRTDFNQLSSQYIENLRSYRSTVADLGSQHQAGFSVTNNSVNQEISIATSILQTVNTIANVIFSQQKASANK